jgi:hypothetical protein
MHFKTFFQSCIRLFYENNVVNYFWEVNGYI